MGKKRIMRNFRLTEISGVDSPAQIHARAAIIKRADDEVEGKAGFEISNEGARARLRILVEHQRRSRPALSEAEAVAAGWRALSYKDRNAILAEEDTGDDPTFDYGNVDVEKLADFLLDCRVELIGKASPGLSSAQRFAAAAEAHPEVFKISREAKRVKLAARR